MTQLPRIAIVTGASRGIGEAIALGLAQRGNDLALNDMPRQKAVLEGVAKAIRAMGRVNLDGGIVFN